ncbi:MAG: hypothetical protein AAGF31_05755 [Planctomycetota bacterium]
MAKPSDAVPPEEPESSWETDSDEPENLGDAWLDLFAPDDSLDAADEVVPEPGDFCLNDLDDQADDDLPDAWLDAS